MAIKVLIIFIIMLHGDHLWALRLLLENRFIGAEFSYKCILPPNFYPCHLPIFSIPYFSEHCYHQALYFSKFSYLQNKGFTFLQSNLVSWCFCVTLRKRVSYIYHMVSSNFSKMLIIVARMKRLAVNWCCNHH